MSLVMTAAFATPALSREGSGGSAPAVSMFTQPNCPACMRAERFLNATGAHVRTYDITQNPQWMRAFVHMGGVGTPMLVIGTDVIHGFDKQAIQHGLCNQTVGDRTNCNAP